MNRYAFKIDGPIEFSRETMKLSEYIQDHVAVLLAAYAIALKISKDAKGQELIDEDNLDDTLHDVADRISSLILPLCSSESLDEGMKS